WMCFHSSSYSFFYLGTVYICFIIFTVHSIKYFFFNDSTPSKFYSLSLHDALPIFPIRRLDTRPVDETDGDVPSNEGGDDDAASQDRKSTRLNSSHVKISYAVFCLKKKITTIDNLLIIN